MPTGLDLLSEKAAGATPGDRRRSRRTARDILEEMAKVPVTPPAPSAPPSPEPGWLSRTASDVGDWLLGAGQMASNVIRNRFPEAPPEEPEPADVVTAARAGMSQRRGSGVTGTWDSEATAAEAGASPSELVSAVPPAMVPGPPVRPGAAAAVAPAPAIAPVPSQVEVMRQAPGAAVEGIAAPKIPLPGEVGEPIKAPLLPWNATDQEYARHVAENRVAALLGPAGTVKGRLPQRSTTMGPSGPDMQVEAERRIAKPQPEEIFQEAIGSLRGLEASRAALNKRTVALQADLAELDRLRGAIERGLPTQPLVNAFKTKLATVKPAYEEMAKEAAAISNGARRAFQAAQTSGQQAGIAEAGKLYELGQSAVSTMAGLARSVGSAIQFAATLPGLVARTVTAADVELQAAAPAFRPFVSRPETPVEEMQRGSLEAREAETLAAQESVERKVQDFGAMISRYWDETAKQFPSAYEGRHIASEPALLLDPVYLAKGVIQTAPTIAAAMIPAVGAQQAIVVGGRLFRLTPELIYQLARVGAATTGGVVGGGLEGMQTYEEILRRGGGRDQAAKGAILMGLASAGLNTLSFTKMFGRPGAGPFGRVKHVVGAGFTEAGTEALEEPSEALILGDNMLKALKEEGIDVAVPSFITGGFGAALAGRRAEGGARGQRSDIGPPQPLDPRLLALEAFLRQNDPALTRGQTPAETQESGRQAALKALERERPQFVPAPETAAPAPAPSAPAPAGAAAPAPPVAEAPTKVPEPPEAAPEPAPAPPVALAPERPAEGEEEAPKAPVTGFTTSLGSTYAVDDEGRTTRTKAPHPGHPATDVGLKERSDQTVYVEPEVGREIGMHLSLNAEAKPRVLVEGDRIVLTRLGRGQTRQEFPFETAPRTGLAPVEFWANGAVHPGTPITAVSTEVAPPAVAPPKIVPPPPTKPPEAPKVEPPPVKPPEPAAADTFTLPRDLAGAKPRFGYGSDNYTLDFESDLDKALFTVAQTLKNKRDADYMAALRTVYSDSEEQAVRDLGRAVKDRVKLLVKDQDAARPVRVPAIMRVPAAKAVPAPAPPAVAPKVETPPEPAKPPAEKPKAEEPFDPNDINQLVRFVRARGRIAPSPSGDLVGEYADVPAHFKSKKGLSPAGMAEAIEEASGIKLADWELLGRLRRYKHLQAQQAATRAAERKDQAAQAALADLTEADLIRELAARLGITEDAARQIIEAGRPKVDEEAATAKLVLDAAARIEDARSGFLSEDELVDAVSKETGRNPDEVRAILGQRETTAEALDADPVQLIIDGAEQPEASPQRARARDLMDFAEELVDASGGVEEARTVLEALPDDAESATPGRQGLPSVALTKDDQRALLEYAFPRDRVAGVPEKAGARPSTPTEGAGRTGGAAASAAGGEGAGAPEGGPAAGAPGPAGGVEERRGRYTSGRGPRQQTLPGAETEVDRPGEAAQLPLGVAAEERAPSDLTGRPLDEVVRILGAAQEGASFTLGNTTLTMQRDRSGKLAPFQPGRFLVDRPRLESLIQRAAAVPEMKTERTAFGDQGLIPGAEGRTIPTTKIAPEQAQRPIEETPLFGQKEAARDRESDEAQGRLFERRAAYRAVAGSPTFRHWFGDSKVVDEDGTPRVVYHGTGQPGFEAVDPAKLDPGALYGPGFYMTESPAIAGGTAGERTDIQFFPTREEAEAAPNRSGFVWSAGPEYHENEGKWAAVIKTPFTERRGYAHKVAPRNRPPTEINADVEALRRSPEHERMMALGYLTEAERGEAERVIRDYELSGNEMYLDMVSGQPFNFPAYAILERGGLRGAGGVYPLYAKIERPMAVGEPLTPDSAERLTQAVAQLGWTTITSDDGLTAAGLLRDMAVENDRRMTGEQRSVPGREDANTAVEEALRDVGGLIIPVRRSEMPEGGWRVVETSVGELRERHWPELFRAAGYDGITHIGGRGDREHHRVWIAFTPTQVKSATGNVGTFSAEDASMVQEPRAPYASLPPDRFYSALRRAAEFRMPVKASADQVLATLRQTPGVKAEEIKDTGLEDWLRAQGDRPITRAEVLEYLRANEVRVEIRRLGGRDQELGPADAQTAIDEGKNVYFLRRADVGAAYSNGPLDHIGDRALAEVEGGEAVFLLGGTGTQFAQYALPGALPGTYVELLAKVAERPGWDVFDPGDGKTLRTFETEAEARQFAEATPGLDYARAGQGSPQYTEPHFREPGVVFHVRGAEHLDDQGRRGFLIEEAQSQWHLEGRRKGYKGPDAFIDGHDYDWWIRETERLFANPSKRDEWRRAVENRDALARTMHAVLPAPFAKSWHDRAFKEALDYALRLPPDSQGRRIEWIGWTPGRVQADRYDLSKQVTSAMWSEWNGRPDGTGTLLVVRRGNDRYEAVARDIPVAKLENHVGKEVAERLRNAPPNQNRDRVVAGLDLKIGGEWAYNLYDRTLPNFVRGYVKKWGAKVGDLPVVTRHAASPAALAAMSQEEREIMLRNRDILAVSETRPVHAVPITDAMRRAVLEEGQAAFEPRARYPRTHDKQAENLAQQALFGVAGAAEGQSLSSRAGVLPGRRDRTKTFALGFRGSLTAEGVARDLAALGEVDLRGRKLASAADAAVAFEVIRNPQVEAFWRFYLNDADEVVGHVMFTAGLPGSAPVKSAATWAEEVPAILAEMRAVGATRVVLGHNHPTGDPAASAGDVEMTRRYERDIPGFQHHVIKDGPTYGLIRAGDKPEVLDLPGAPAKDPLLTPAIPHRVIRVPIASSEDIAALLGSLKAADGQALILYAGGAERRVRGAQVVPLADLRNPATAETWFLDQGRAFGSSEVFVYTPKQDADFYRLADSLIRSGALRDYVFGPGVGHSAAGPEPVIPEFTPGQVRRVEKLGPRAAAEGGLPAAVPVGGEPAIRVVEQPRDEAGRFVSTEPGKALSDFLAGDEPGGVAEETGRYEAAGEGAEPDIAAEIERLRAENVALREKRDATVKRARKGKEGAKKPQDDPVPADPGPEAVKEHNARVEALPEEVRSNAVIRDTLYGPRRFLGLARRWFEARARGARAQSDRVTDEARAAAREALGNRADTLVIQGTPKDFGLFDMWDRPSRRIAMFGPLAESLIDTINLGELRMRIEYGERMDTEVTGFRHVPRADWGKHGERFYDAFAGHPIDDILADPALALETKAAMVGLRDRMDADRLFIRDRKREENRGWVSRRVERELRAAGFALPPGGGRRGAAEMTQLRAEVDRVTDERLRDMIPDAWGIEDYLPELYPGEFKIEVQKADGTWGFFGNGTNRMDAIRRVIEDSDLTGRPLGAYRVSHRMFMDPDVLRVSNARHWKFVGDLADALAVSQDDILAASRGVISTKGRREKFWGSLKHRAGFEQYRKDMLFVLSLYHSGFARWHWLTDIRRAVAPGIEEIRRRGQPNLADEIEANLEILWGHRSGTSRHLDASIERIPVLRDYHVAGTLERLTNRTKGLSAVLFLLTSPRFHLVNRLQTWQTLWPLVSNAEFFWGHALWGFGPWGGKLVLIGDEVYFPGRFDETHPIPADGVVLDGPEILWRHGVEHLASGKFYGEGEVSVLHRAKEAIRHRTPEALARRAPERYNQEVAFLTLYLKGRRAGMSDRAAADYAFLQGNLRSQFAGAKTDQPRLLGRTIPTGEAAPVKSVITQYKRFQVANLGLGIDLLKEAGRKDPTGRRHPAGFLKWLAALVAIGGLKGLLNPLLGLLGLGTLGAGWLTMKSYDALKEQVGEWQADLVMYGLPSVLGIDLSYSMQLLDTPLSRNLPGSIFEMLLGPMGSLLAGGIGAAWEDKRHGYVASPWERGWKAVAQRAPGLRAIGAAEQLARGETMIRDPAGRARFRANLTDMLRYAAGFRTMTQAEQDRIVSAFLDVAVQRDRVVEASTKELVGLRPNPTERDIDEAWKRVGRRLDRWNGLFPEGYFVITGKDVNQRIKDREKFRDLDVLERVVARAPKSLRGYFRGRTEERARGKAEATP